MEFLVSKELLEATINYLANRPWGEVQSLMSALSQVKPAEKQEESKKEDKKKEDKK